MLSDTVFEFSIPAVADSFLVLLVSEAALVADSNICRD